METINTRQQLIFTFAVKTSPHSFVYRPSLPTKCVTKCESKPFWLLSRMFSRLLSLMLVDLKNDNHYAVQKQLTSPRPHSVSMYYIYVV